MPLLITVVFVGLLASAVVAAAASMGSRSNCLPAVAGTTAGIAFVWMVGMI